MGSFADRVVLEVRQPLALVGPLQKDFLPADWTRNWKELRTDDADDRLFRSGLWMGRRWSALHRHKADLERMVTPLNPKRQVLAWLNEQAGIQMRQLSEHEKLLVLRVSHMIQPIRVRTDRRAVSSRSAANHPSDSVH